MSTYRSTLQHAGKTIIFHNYRGLGCEEYANAILQNMQHAATDDAEEKLVLLDVAETVVDKKVMKAYKLMAKNTSLNLSKIAVIGAAGIQKMFVQTVVNLFRLNVRIFASKEEALTWLTL